MKWIGFLNEHGIAYDIRIRENFFVFCHEKQKEIRAWHLFNNLKVGQMRHYHKIMKINDEFYYLSGVNQFKINFYQFLSCT